MPIVFKAFPSHLVLFFSGCVITLNLFHLIECHLHRTATVTHFLSRGITDSSHTPITFGIPPRSSDDVACKLRTTS